MLIADELSDPAAAIAALPAGRYAVGVSGGADSVALLRLLHARGDCAVVVHLDHELRGAASDADAAFVRDLAQSLGLPAAIEKRSAIRLTDAPANAHAAYRAARHRLFARVVVEQKCHAVLLAHHADDQAETVLIKLIRGGGLESLGGMRPSITIDGVRFLRPLLNVRAATLRDYLRSIDQPWREDASNTDPRYRRTRVRELLQTRPSLLLPLRGLARTAQHYVDALDRHTPEFPETFDALALTALPPPLARRAARRWLATRGGSADDLSQAVCRRLIQQAQGNGPLRQHYPGGVLVRYRKGRIEPSPGRDERDTIPDTHHG